MKNLYLLLITVILFQSGYVYAQDFKVVGYFPSYRFALNDQIEYDKLTHLMLAFLNPDSLGNWSIANKDIDPIVARARLENPDIEVFISIAGGGLTAEWAAAYEKFMQASRKSAFIHSLMEYVRAHGLDGVDVDLEWSHVNALYSPFVIELADSLHADGKQMTSAWPGTTRYADITDPALARFDFVNMMVYDLTGPWQPNNPGQHSPYSFAQQSISFWKSQGVSRDRLVLGVPFYGRDWSTGKTGQAFTYGSMIDQDTAYAWVDEVNDKYYNGIPTIRAKTMLAMMEVSGIMIWELGQDALGNNKDFSLLRAIHEQAQSTVQSIDLLSLAEHARFVPNPFQDELNILYTGVPSPATILIRDIRGRTLKHQQTFLTNNGIQLSAVDLPTGLYICELIVGKQVLRQKLIKR